ncbi:MAG: S8 family serine peptidase [Sphingobacteriales bacterium]|nr:S8 family serine peptidase [Sphingobacteriales bacterium]
MNISRFLLVSLLLSLLAISQASAQLKTNADVLERASQLTAQKETARYNQLQTLARQKGWPISLRGKKGRIAILREVNAQGIPIYFTTLDNVISAATIRTNLLWPGGSTGLALNGSSSTVKGKIAIWDEAKPLPTHVELTGRVTQKDNPGSVSDHSTHVAGTMIAAGVNPLAKGMAYGQQQLLAYDWNNDNSEMLAAAPQLLVSNHSYGVVAGWNYNSGNNHWEFYGDPGDTADYKFGYYDEDSQMWDSIAYNAPNYLILKAAGNNRGETGPAVGQPYYRYDNNGNMVYAGLRPTGISSNDAYDDIATSAGAKNILTVGAVNPIPGGYSSPSDVVMSDFSSWGPTDDGRIKPDVVANGVNVLSCIGTSNTAYDTYSGTSMATPSVTGSLLLLQEYYAKLHSGSFMRSATLKGLAIHTADEAGIADGPDYSYGWGLVDVQKAAGVITSDTSKKRDQAIYENTLTNSTADSYTLDVVASGNGPLIATISWTDPPGAVSTTNLLNNPAKKLINDLDIRITDGTTTWYPYVLDPSHPWNGATTGDDATNNVEKIVIKNVIPGHTYTIKVSHKGTLARGSQAYSLLLSGIGGSSYCTSAPTSSTGTRIDKVSFGDIQNTTAAGCTTYRDYTNLGTGIQPGQQIPISVTLSSCDASTNARVIKVFIDYNHDGIFSNNELAAVSDVLGGGATTWSGAITASADLTPGSYGIMRIVAQETTDTAAVKSCGSYTAGETEDYTVRFLAPVNNTGVTAIVAPIGAVCSADFQLVTVTIKNFGSANQSQVGVTTVISTDGNTVATLNAVYPQTIPASGSVTYTYQSGFTMIAGKTYTITSYTTLTTDQLHNDDTTTATVSVNAAVTATGQAEICGADKTYLKATTGAGDIAFWYDNATATTPFTTSADTSTTDIPSNKTYYLQLNGSGKVGPTTKEAYASGGYNVFSGNFVNFTNDVPVTIENARLYIGYPGKITFIVADITNLDTTSGSYSYTAISSTTIDAYATNPNPQAGSITGNPSSDTGAVFHLGLSVPTAGKHSLIISSDGNASIFRNNGITSQPYPFTLPGIFSITGNSALSTTNSSLYQQYYYFFYDMQVRTANCPSARTAITASAAPAPVISINGNILTSTQAATYQWYINDSLMKGHTSQTDTANVTGVYTVVATDAFGCSQTSNAISYNAGKGAIYLSSHPNPSKGSFEVNFITGKAGNVDLFLYNVLGQEVYHQYLGNTAGVYSYQVNVPGLAAGIYLLKIQVGKDAYTDKILIAR